MARIHGKHGEVMMDPTGAALTVAVADLNAWTIDLGKDLVDVTAFGDTNKQSVMGLANYTGTLGGWWNSLSSPTLFDAILGETAVTLKLVPNSVEPTYFFSGLAYLDGGINVSATGAVSLTSKWSASGNWTMAP